MDNLLLENKIQISPSAKLLDDLVYEYGSSFYLFNKGLFVRNLKEFRAAFEVYYSNIKIGYSYKTNYIPRICKLAKAEKALAEVVSGLEYELALKVGYEGDDIIFNGPLKEKKELFNAFKNDSIVHFDSYEEIKILKEYLKQNPDRIVKCALRCNFDIGEDGISRFGFDTESGEAQEVYKELFALKGCSPVGIHCHFSTNHRSIDSFRRRTSALSKFSKQIFKRGDLKYIDIGGGFFGGMPESIKALFPFEVPSFEDYGKVVGRIMDESFPDQEVSLILEPGASVVANTMSFICRVASVKQIQGKSVVTLTGSIHNVRPTGSKGDIPFRTIKASEKNKLEDALIGGYTCMESDIISRSFGGDLNVGDYLIFDNMGAYNIVFKPPFIKEAPPILQFSNEKEELNFEVVREQESLNQIFSSYKF